jgi:hypothetical protein
MATNGRGVRYLHESRRQQLIAQAGAWRSGEFEDKVNLRV